MSSSGGTGSRTGKGTAQQRPHRPRELQDPLNHYLYHPLAWQLALRLARTPLTPNMVSVIGGFFVVGAAIAYYQPGWPLPALVGMFLHMSWHVVDGADGDLARLTGRSSPIGEMVDGICDYASHIVLYVVLASILTTQIGPIQAWLWTLAAGASHILQANHVEVQRRQYQWWVYGTPWLRNTHKSGSVTTKSGFGALVSAYLNLANGLTPHALEIDKEVAEAQGSKSRLDQIRGAVAQEAPGLLPILKILGPNSRAIVLGISMLAGSPVYYFAYETVLLNVVLIRSVRLHNAAARRIVHLI